MDVQGWPFHSLGGGRGFANSLAEGCINVSLGGANNEIILIQPTNTNTVATARFVGGVNGKRYKITCRITTADSTVFERNIFLRVRSI